MNRFSALLLGIIVLIFAGCSSSEDTTGKQESQPPAASASQPPAQAPAKADTVNVNIQDTQRPDYSQSSPPAVTEPIGTPGTFVVQIGAYKQSENAERIASIARERFSKNVYTIPDKINDLYKVMVGDFILKDEARKFRDEMVQKYPNDYKDAWVSELPKK